MAKELDDVMAAAPEILPEDSGVIRCICGYDHDDEFTIQCERCNAWLHAVCVDIFNSESVPETFICPLCSGKPYDTAAAQDRQQKVLKRRRKSSVASHDTPKRRSVSTGGKRHRPLELEILDNADLFFIPTTRNRVSKTASEYINLVEPHIPSLDNTKVPLKSSPITVVRQGAGFGLSATVALAAVPIARDRFIFEINGEVQTKEEFQRDPVNQYRELGCPKPGVISVPKFALVIDGRRWGSGGVFLRRSYKPNVRLEPKMVDNELRVFAYAVEAIKPGTELTTCWDWHPSHPIWKLKSADKDELTGSEQTALDSLSYLLDVPLEELRPPLTSEPAPPDINPPSHFEVIRTEFLRQHESAPVLEEPLVAPSQNVWVAAKVVDVPPKKKKLSFADYKRKLSSTQ